MKSGHPGGMTKEGKRLGVETRREEEMKKGGVIREQ